MSTSRAMPMSMLVMQAEADYAVIVRMEAWAGSLRFQRLARLRPDARHRDVHVGRARPGGGRLRRKPVNFCFHPLRFGSRSRLIVLIVQK
jgi:hypothetical protein